MAIFQKQHEEAKKEESDIINDRFRGIFASSTDGLVFVSLNGFILDVNDSFCKITGYSREELLSGVTPSIYTSSEYLALDEQALQMLLMTGNPVRYEKEYVTKKGSCVPILLNAFVVKNKIGESIGRASIVKDITLQKKAQAALQQSEDKLRRVFESVNEGIIITDLRGVITESNNKIAEIFGFSSKGELAGKNFFKLVAEKDHKRIVSDWRKVVKARLLQNNEFCFLKANKTGFPGEASFVALVDASGVITSVIATIRDITERKQIKKKMRYYLSGITKAQEEERKRIARDMHDDILQPLANILFDIDLIGSADHQCTILDIKNRLTIEVSGIMKVVRRFAQELRPDVLDRLGLVPALELLITELYDRGITARLNITGSERRLSSESEITLFRIAQEALHNIKKHSKAKQARVTVDFRKGKVRLHVTDDGCGFEPPKQLTNFALTHRLGLIGIYERLKPLNGSLDIKSQKGTGTAITVELSASGSS